MSDLSPLADPPVQAAGLPFCRRDDGVYVCLVRRRDSPAWGIPKGFIEPGDTDQETVLNEAWEEGGLRGRVVGEPLGTYRYRKFWSSLAVVVYLLDVTAEEPTWPEQRTRERRWYPMQEALDLLEAHPVRHLLTRAAARIIG